MQFSKIKVQVRDYTNETCESSPEFNATGAPYGIISPLIKSFQRGDVSELADEHDLGSCAERRKGSIPFVPILQHVVARSRWSSSPVFVRAYRDPARSN